MTQKINFYFDFLSPYSYFAWQNSKQKNWEITPKIILMGQLFRNFDFKGPGEIPVKRKSELRKCFQYATLKNIPFNPPSTHPFNPMMIAKMATTYASADQQYELINEIFALIWGKSTVLDDPEIVKEHLSNYSAAYERASEPEAKKELKANIKSAINLEIFGVPTFEIKENTFWGNDSIELVESYLESGHRFDIEKFNDLLGIKK